MALDDMPRMDELEKLAAFIGCDKPYIYGDSVASRMIGKYLEQASVKVNGFIVPQADEGQDEGQKEDGSIPVLSIQEAERHRQKERVKVILAAGTMTGEAFSVLRKVGIEDIFVVSEWNTQAIIKKMSPKTAEKFDLEVNLADHCNLNCQCCDHFAPLAEKNFIDYDSYAKDIDKLSQLQKNINSIVLLGGEPLLNNKCIDYFKITRKYFPDTNIILFTNGLLLPKWSSYSDDKNIWLAIKKYDVQINLTRYPIPLKLDMITEQAKKHDIPIVFEQPSTKGAKLWILLEYGNLKAHKKTSTKHPFDVSGSVEKYRFIHCYHFNKCLTLRNGKIYTCPIIPNSQWYNKKFNQHLEVTENCSIDLHRAQSFEEITEFLTHRPSFCDYCAVHKRYAMPWKQSRGGADEWTLLLTEEKNMAVTITDMKRCTGCAACANACPRAAITMRENEEGFYKPVIDEKLCVQCRICEKTCPQNHAHDQNNPVPPCFAFMAEDSIRLKSSSGGAFGILAREFLRRGGVVVGAAFDEHWQVRHIIAETEAELEKLRSSKYVQSFISETLLKNVRALLEKGVPVLFSGVPCQVAGLLNYLTRDYDNLCTVDLLCAYAPSPKAWRQYLEENYADIPLAAINMRDKTVYGWNALSVTLTTTSGDVMDDKKYMTPYLGRMFKGSQCEHCAYKRLPRPGDFTIGDFWRIQQFAPDCDDRKGTSGILLNNKKAELLFESLTDGIKLKKAMPLHTLAWQLGQEPQRLPACLDFFKHINDKPFNVNSREAQKNTRVGITNWWFINNRGAILTNYALNEMVNSLGYNALTINYISPHERNNFFNKGYVKKFADAYLKRTRWLENLNDLKSLNNDIQTFVLGSDQIFNYFPCNSHGKQYYGWWVEAKNNKLISYAASFCNDYFRATEAQKNLVRHFLKRFDYHSIREVEGVELMKNTFGLDAKFILDPVFCIDKNKYLNIAEKATDKPDEDFIAYYITLPDRIKSQDLQKLLDWTLEKTGCTRAIDLFSWDISMENWLWYFIHAKFIIGNSFHGACLSLIFNKPYLVYAMDGKHDSRFSTIARLGGQKERIFYHLGDIYQAEWLFDEVDFSYFNSTIQKRIDEAYAWLKNALDSPKQNTLTEEEDIYDALINDYDEKIAQIYGYINTKVSAVEGNLKKTTDEQKSRADEVLQARADGLQSHMEEVLKKNNNDLQVQVSDALKAKLEGVQRQTEETLEKNNTELQVQTREELKAKLEGVQRQTEETLEKNFSLVQAHMEEMRRDMYLLSHKNSILFNYWRYRIGKNFIFKRRYTEKSRSCKEKLQRIRELQRGDSGK